MRSLFRILPLLVMMLMLMPDGNTVSGAAPHSQQQEKKKRRNRDEVKQPASSTPQLIAAKKEAVIGNMKGARELFRQYIERFPEDPVGQFELARIETELNNYDEAIILCREAHRLDPENKWYTVYLADLCQTQGKTSEALGLYKELVANEPDNVDYLYQLAAVSIQAEKYTDAIAVYNRIEERVGVAEEVSMQKQKIYLHLNDLAGAEREVKKLIAAFPEETRYYSILAEFYLANGMPDKALETYRKIAAMNPDDPYIHMSMADYYRKTGDRQKAFEELKLGFSNPNLDIDTKVNILLSFYTVNQLYNDLKDEAFELADILVKTHPKDPKAYSIEGDLLLQDKKYTEARQSFLKVLAIDSSRYAIWGELLQLDLQLNELEHLRSYSRRAADLFPEQPLPLLYLGLANLQLKDNDAALRALASGANLVVDNNYLLAQFYMYQGDALHAMKNDDEAFQAYDRSIKLVDSNSYVLNNYAYYLSLKGKDLDKAEKMAKRAVTLDPKNGSFLDTYGWVLFKMGDFKGAAEWILKALQTEESPSAEVLEHYGDALFNTGDATGALDYWNRAKLKGGGSDRLDRKITDKKYYP